MVMNTQPQSIYQRVIDKTKSVAFQTQFIAQSIEKRLELQRAQQARVKREVLSFIFTNDKLKVYINIL